MWDNPVKNMRRDQGAPGLVLLCIISAALHIVIGVCAFAGWSELWDYIKKK